MTLLQVLTVLAYIAIGCVILLAVKGRLGSIRIQWLVPAIVEAAFLIFSLVTLAQDGLIQF